MKVIPVKPMPKGLPTVVKEVNNEIDALTSALRGLNYPKLDSDVYDNCAGNPHMVAESIIVQRFTKYWERPDASTAQSRRQKSVMDWWSSDQRVKNIRVVKEMGQYSPTLYRIGTQVLKLLKSIPVQVEFGPGESFKTQHGKTHLLSKLDPSTHTVSYDCLELWINLICSTRGLLLPYIRYYVKNLKGSYSVVKDKIRNGINWRKFIVNAVINSFDDYIVYGSRQSFVDKDNDEDRAIEINPLGDVVLQKHVGDCFRKVLATHGIDLDDGQRKHVLMLAQRVSTLDASKASDTITRDHLWGFPKELQEILIRLSQEFILVTDIYGNKVWHKQAKLCSMGNGFTFELLTTVMYSIAYRHSPRLTLVYGDDVIVEADKGRVVMRALERAGFVMNKRKSFVDNPVRESCGGFFVEGYGYVTTFKLEYCKNMVDVVKTANKIYRVYKSLQHNYPFSVVSPILQRTHERLLSIIPTLFKGPPALTADIPDWVESEKWLKSRARSKNYLELSERYRNHYELLAWDQHRRICDYAIVLVPTLKNEVDYHIKNIVRRKDVVLAAVKQRRRTDFEKSSVRPKCVIKTRIVVRDGYLVS